MRYTLLHKIQAFRTNFELVCLFAVVALVADLGWVVHDVISNGISLAYILIGSGLAIAIAGTIWVMIRHNSVVVREIRHARLLTKLAAVKHKTKHGKSTK